MRLRVTLRASRDITSIADYISNENPKAAIRVGERIEQAFDLLTYSPMIGRHGNRPGIREFAVRGLPFLIIYRIADDTVEVITVFHTSQNPLMKE